MKPTSDSTDIDPQIQALVIAARRFAKAQVPMMGLIADLGLRPPEIILLYSLGRARHEAREGASCGVNPSDLAMRMGVTPGHVTQLLTSLEREGMVARESDPADRRRVLVTLTERGRSALEEANARLARAYADLAASLGRKDTERFIALLEKAAKHFAALGGGRPCLDDSFGRGRDR